MDLHIPEHFKSGSIPIIEAGEKLTPEELQDLMSRMTAAQTTQQIADAAKYAVEATFEKIGDRLKVTPDEEMVIDFKTGKITKRKAAKPKEEDGKNQSQAPKKSS